jgi:hypothetical protein
VLTQNEDALGWLRVVTKERANLTQSPEAARNVVGFCAGACVIRVPRLLHLRELGLELADARQDARQDAYSLGQHGEWFSLGYTFFAEDKDGATVIAAEHECRPVFLVVKHIPSGHLCHTAHSILIQLCLLNALEASMSKNPQFSSILCKSQRACIAWMLSSMPASKPAQSWPMPQASLASAPATRRRIFAVARRQVLPMPTGWTPGHSFRAHSHHDINAWYPAQGEKLLESQSVKSARASQSSRLATPNLSSQCLSAWLSVPPSPLLPNSRPATFLMASAVMSTLTKLSVWA